MSAPSELVSSGALPAGASTFLALLDQSLTAVRVRFVLPSGAHDVGADTTRPPHFNVRVSDPTFFSRVIAQGTLGLAESYMDDGWAMQHGALEEFLSALMANRVADVIRRSPLIALRLAALRVRHKFISAAQHVHVHYDLGDDLYASFLDETRGYSCGYQLTPDDDSRTLQENKYDRICRKIHLQPGQTLFDIGCGFGGLLIHAAQHYGARCTGITNSPTHAAFANSRARALGLADRVTVHVGDFRAATGTYDRVVSVGMFEHMFRSAHRDYFATFSRLLAPGGYGLVHSLGCVTARNSPDPFIQKYIFPGSAQNPLSTIVRGLELAGLPILDVENIARHYHPTTRRWLEAFRANQHTLDPVRYDARFQRMWELYLAGCVAATLYSDGALWQIVVTNHYRRPLPLHRVGKT